jgi:hypothetical protein
MEKAMKIMIAGLALAAAAAPAAAEVSVSMRFACPPPTAVPSQPPELPGLWDLVMDVGGTPSFGLLSLGMADGKLAGSISLNAGVAVVRSLTLDGQAVTLVVTTGEGDVRFDGTLTADGKRMCGIVTYHGGQKLAMVAQKTPGPRPRDAGQRAGTSGGGGGR